MMRLQDRKDMRSLIGSLEAVNSGVALHQRQNWFSCQRVNCPAAFYSFRASPGTIPSPCHSCLMSNTVYAFHTLLLLMMMMMKVTVMVMMVIFGSSSQFFPFAHRTGFILRCPEANVWFAYARTNSKLPPSKVTVNQHRFLKDWNECLSIEASYLLKLLVILF